MSKVKVTPLRTQVGDYGRVHAHQTIEVDSELASKLVAGGLWVKGLSPKAKANDKARRDAEKAASTETSEA